MSSRVLRWRLAGRALWLGLVAAALATACQKEQESLILVAITVELTPALPPTRLTLATAERDVSFALEAPLSSDPYNPTTFGIYVAETGLVKVDVTVFVQGGGCAGFVGSGAASINAPGDTRSINVVLVAANVCGTGTGQGGAGGSPPCPGPPPPAGVAPSLTCCTTYDHADPPSGQYCDGNDTYVYTAAFSPDGTLAVTGGDDGRAVFWTYDGVKLEREGHFVTDADYGYAAFSPDGTLVAVGGTNRVDVFHIKGPESWTSAGALDVDGLVYGIGFAPDSQRVITLDSKGNLYVHAVTKAEALDRVKVPVAEPYALAVAPAAVGGALGVAVIDAAGRSAGYGLTGNGLGAPIWIDTGGIPVWGGCFSPAGSLLALGDTRSHLRFYDLPSGARSDADVTIGGAEDVRGCAFSPNGSYVAVAGGRAQGVASIAGVFSRALISRYDIPNARVTGLSVAFAPTGNAILVGGRGCGKVLLCRE